MSIIDWSNEGGVSGFDMECDLCGQATFFDRTYFRDFWDDAKRCGWRMTKGEDNKWTHLCPVLFLCPACASKEKE